MVADRVVVVEVLKEKALGSPVRELWMDFGDCAG